MTVPPNPAFRELSNFVNGMIDQINHHIEVAYSSVGSAFEAPANWLKHMDPDGSSINASSQSLYWSEQLAKFDVSAVTASFDGFKVDESGVYLMGAKIYEFPWVSALENGRGTASAAARTVTALEGRVDDLAQSRTRVDGRLADLRTDVDRARTIARSAHDGAVDLVADLEQDMRRRFGRVDGDIKVVEGSAKRAHRRLDAVDRVRRRQGEAIRAAAGAPSVTSQDPKRLKDAAAQVRALESRVTDLLRALG
ncbi:hypothetical protein [Streptomyces sp. bgisy154]|uniref:hypothetical protein n=1 Tax=Streptomyces sp. bgisy154 TaxID=3413794 RepID=UPI003D7535C0